MEQLASDEGKFTDLLIDMKTAYQQLSDVEKTVVSLTTLGYPITDIARITGLSRTTIHKIKKGCLRALAAEVV